MTVYVVDADQRVVALPADVPQPDMLQPGWRWARPSEIEAHRERGADADLSATCDPIYDVAARLGAPLGAHGMAALVTAIGGTVRTGPVRPLGSSRGGEVDVRQEMERIEQSPSPAWLLWRITWLHGLRDGNGRTGRAAAYAALCQQIPELRDAHARRAGSYGRRTLTVPERLERNRSEYVIVHMNGLHEAHARGGGTMWTARLEDLGEYLLSLAADQIVGRPSRDDLP